MDMQRPSMNLRLIVLRARSDVAQATALLADLSKTLQQHHIDPATELVVQNLNNAIWTMNGTLAAYQDDALMLREVGNQDQAPNAIQAALDEVNTLNRPLEVLIAAVLSARVRLAEIGGQSQPSAQ